jgi:hypothetical protein
MTLSWEDCETKLKALGVVLENDDPQWIHAEAQGEEIAEQCPDIELEPRGPGKIYQASDFRLLEFRAQLYHLRTAVKKQNKAVALETLSAARKLVESLKRKA